MTDPNNPGATPPATPDPAATSQQGTGQGGEQGQAAANPQGGTDYEAAYKGLQPKYQTLVETAQATTTKLTGERDAALGRVQDLTTQLQAANAKLAELEGKTTSSSQTVQSLEADKAKLEAQNNRWKLLAAEFPQLVGFEAKELLPPLEGATPEAMRDGFSQYWENVKTLAGAGGPGQAPGSAPPSNPQTPGGNVANEDQLWEEAMAANKANDPVKYNAAMDQIMKRAQVSGPPTR